MRNAMNEVLRTSYVRDCELGLKRWNRQLERSGIAFRLALPSSRFNRTIGVWSGTACDLTGNLITADDFAVRREEWLPSGGDREFVKSLMQRVVDRPGWPGGSRRPNATSTLCPSTTNTSVCKFLALCAR